MMAAAEPKADILPSDKSTQAIEDYYYLRWRKQAVTHRDPLGMNILVIGLPSIELNVVVVAGIKSITLRPMMQIVVYHEWKQ